MLLLGNFMHSLVGLDSHEPSVLLELLQRQITMPENTIRWNREPVDVTVEDNQSHNTKQPTTTTTSHTSMHRVTLVGDVPVNMHDEHSRIVSCAPLSLSQRSGVIQRYPPVRINGYSHRSAPGASAGTTGWSGAIGASRRYDSPCRGR